jgi:hypothetical protein
VTWSRHSQDLRNRIINDFEKVCDEYDLHGKQREAATSMINVGKGGKVSDHVRRARTPLRKP